MGDRVNGGYRLNVAWKKLKYTKKIISNIQSAYAGTVFQNQEVLYQKKYGDSAGGGDYSFG